MRRLIFRGLWVFSLFFTQACTTASFRIPNNRFMSPENSGELGDGFVAAGYGSKTNVIVAQGELNTAEEIKDSAEVRNDDGIFLQAAAGLHPVAEVFFNNEALGAKFQFVGEPASKAEAGNFSLSLGLAYDAGSNSSSSSFAGDLTYTLKTEAKFTGLDTMLLGGYRITRGQLLYANIASATYEAKGSITKEYTSSAAIGTAEKITIPARTVRSTTLLLGWQALNDQAYVMVEGGYSFAAMEEANKKDRLVLGSTLGIRW